MSDIKKHTPNVCFLPKWQLLKSTLKNFDLTEFRHRAKRDTNAVILDVRTFNEYREGHIENAINLDYLSYSLADDIDLLDKSKSYYVYCKTGRRSLRVCILLKNSGFKSIYNLNEGIGNMVF